MKTISPHLRLASSLSISNIWLFTPREGWNFLVDTGHFLERPLLRRFLFKAGIRRKGDLTAVLLTHRHSDHAGNAAWLRKTFDCPVVCHAHDAPFLTGEKKPERLVRGVGRLYEEFLCHFEDRLPAKCPIDDTFTTANWRWGFRIVHTPGHTEGSVMLYQDGILFSGDSILAGPPPLRLIEMLGLAKPGFSLDVEKCHREVRRFLKDLPPVQAVCSGHGPAVVKDARDKLLRLLTSECDS